LRLSDRLETIIDMIPPCQTAADIGTDHGFVPIELVRRGTASRAVASDVRKGPLERARAHIEEAGLSDRIGVRLGSGLSTLSENEADVILIAGMGGLLMIRLLTEGEAVLKSAKTLVLSPHTDVPKVRRFIAGTGFSITDEEMVEEDGKFYTVLKCEKKKMRKMSEKACLFGPVLLEKRPPVFVRYLESEYVKTVELIGRMEEENVPEEVLREKRKYLRQLKAVLKTVH